MSSMLTESGPVPAAAHVVRGRHAAPRPRARYRIRVVSPMHLVGSLVLRTLPAPAEAPLAHSTPLEAPPVPGLQVLTPPAAAAPVPAARAGEATGVVDVVLVVGETVADVAARYGVSTASLLAFNGLSWRSPLEAGSILRVRPATDPAALPERPVRHHTVAPGDTVAAIAGTHGLPTAALLLANGLSRGSAVDPGRRLVIPPVRRQRTSTGQALALTGEMRANARLILGAGSRAGVTEDGLVTGLIAAMQDSALRNLDFDDSRSGGLFQRRPGSGWGTAEQILDPVHAAAAFFGGSGSPVHGTAPGLLDTPGWELMSVAEAASVVQGAGGAARYGKWEHSARSWLAELA